MRVHREIWRVVLEQQEHRRRFLADTVALNEPLESVLVRDFEQEIRRIVFRAFVDCVEEGFNARRALVHHPRRLDRGGDFIQRRGGDVAPIREMLAKTRVGAVAVNIGSVLRHKPGDEMTGRPALPRGFSRRAEFIEKKVIGLTDVIHGELAHISSRRKYLASPST